MLSLCVSAVILIGGLYLQKINEGPVIGSSGYEYIPIHEDDPLLQIFMILNRLDRDFLGEPKSISVIHINCGPEYADVRWALPLDNDITESIYHEISSELPTPEE